MLLVVFHTQLGLMSDSVSFHYTSQVLDATSTEPWWEQVARFYIKYNLFPIFIKILTFAHLSFIINFFVSPLY